MPDILINKQPLWFSSTGHLFKWPVDRLSEIHNLALEVRSPTIHHNDAGKSNRERNLLIKLLFMRVQNQMFLALASPFLLH